MSSTLIRRTARRAVASAAAALVLASGAVTALSTAEAATGTTSTAGSTLTLRSSAGTSGSALASIPHGTVVNIDCKIAGQSISGSQGTTSTWDRVSYGGKTGYVSAAYVIGGTSSAHPTCGKGVVRVNGSTLTLRSSASTSGAFLASIPDGTTLTLQCRTTGTSVAGTQGTTTTWDKVTYGGKTGYVSAAYVFGGRQSYVGSCGTPPAPTAWASPSPSTATVTSRVGPRWGTYHYGTDIAYRGDVKSACTGTVDNIYINPVYPNSNTWDKPNNKGTNYVWVNCGNGIRMGYAHFFARELSGSVKVGAAVRAGQYLFPVGNQGYSTGYHLHWEVRQNGTAIDGLTFLANKGVTGLPR